MLRGLEGGGVPVPRGDPVKGLLTLSLSDVPVLSYADVFEENAPSFPGDTWAIAARWHNPWSQGRVAWRNHGERDEWQRPPWVF